MNQINKLAAALLLGISAAGLAGCATGLPTQVSRYQQMPAPTGQTFYVVPADGSPAGLEFNRYATLVSQQMQAHGYAPAGAPQVASMIVKVSYGVDEGTTEISRDPYGRSRLGFGFGDPFSTGYGGYYDPFYGPQFGRPYWSRYGYWGSRSPFYYGWDDPFWYSSPYAGYGRGYRGAIRDYTVYKSHLDLAIARRADNAPLFEGHAKARSQTDELGVLVPNLVEAMFTGFPGRNGETVKITVPAKKKS